MRSINKVILIGNLTRDPEMRQTPNGQQVATFGIATNREWVTRDGMRHTSSEYHETVAWSRLADICSKYLKKGKLVYIEGYLKTRSWDTPEGIKKFKTEIVIQDMIMLDKRPANISEDYIPEEITGTNNVTETEIEERDGAPDETTTSRSPKRIKNKEEHMQNEDKAALATGTNPHSTDINADLGL